MLIYLFCFRWEGGSRDYRAALVLFRWLKTIGFDHLDARKYLRLTGCNTSLSLATDCDTCTNIKLISQYGSVRVSMSLAFEWSLSVPRNYCASLQLSFYKL